MARSLLQSRWKWLCLLTIVVAQGCATYGADVQNVLSDVRRGDWKASEASLKQTLSDSGGDRLLYFLELGVIRHLSGDYKGSNQLLEKAERISESLETSSVTGAFFELLSNPRQGSYAGTTHEKLYLNYFKALNYIAIAEKETTRNARLDALEGARVEIRRMNIRLNSLNDEEGDYEQRREDKQETSYKVFNIFNKLSGNIDVDDFRFRDDALSHYLAGVTYEMNGELDNARISYRKSAEAYEGGYAKQFRLDPTMTEQAWFDTVRIMRRAGGYESEWPRLAKKKLSANKREELANWDNKAQLLVIEHKGLAPELKEMSLELWANPTLKSFEMQPYVGFENRDALAWFYLLYSDKGIYKALTAYLDGQRLDRFFDPFTKTILLGPAWDVAQELGLDRAIGSSLRITVPYYPIPKVLGDSQLTVATATGSVVDQPIGLYKAASPAQLGIQERMVNADNDLHQALTRSATKLLTAQAFGLTDNKKEGSSLLALAGKLATQLTEASETRSWLLLPNDIRIRRVPLEPGDYQLTLDSRLEAGQQVQETTRKTLTANDIAIWQVRSLPQQASKKKR